MNDKSTVLLVDNGSTLPEATLNLRRLTSELSERTGREIHPVSLMHADKIPADMIDNLPASTFESFTRRHLEQGDRAFTILPLFFGNSRALTNFIPDKIAALKEDFGNFTVKVADPLCPLPEGEPRLASILFDNIKQTSGQSAMDHVILVDHGSPIPEVTAVRQYLAGELQKLLDESIGFSQAVMERREGSEYDFNGALLEEELRELAKRDAAKKIVLAMLFFSPGRHAGPGGDIEEIYRKIEAMHPGFQVYPTPLIGEHPGLIEILQSRLEAV